MRLAPATTAFYDMINAATSLEQMDNLGRTLWHLYSKGELNDDEAHILSGAIEKRRPQRLVQIWISGLVKSELSPCLLLKAQSGPELLGLSLFEF